MYTASNTSQKTSDIYLKCLNEFNIWFYSYFQHVLKIFLKNITYDYIIVLISLLLYLFISINHQ